MMTDPVARIETASPPPALNEHAKRVAASLSSQATSPRVLATWVKAVEVAALMVIGLIISGVILQPKADESGWSLLTLIVLSPFVAIVAIRSLGGYKLTAMRDYLSALPRILVCWTLTIALVAAAGFFLGFEGSSKRLWLMTMFIAGGIFFVIERALLAGRIRRWTRAGRLERRAVIVGGGEYAQQLLEAFGDPTKTDVRVHGIFDDRNRDRSPDEVAGVPKLGTVAELVEFARLAHIDLLIVALPLTAENRVLQLLKKLWILPVDIRISALNSKLRFTPRSYSYIGPVPLLDLFDRPIAGWDSIVKRIFDVVIASIAIVLLSPILLLTAIAIRIDSPGPVFFRQKRYGFNNEVIDVFKFRSMYHHLSDPNAKVVVTKGDPRVTRVGRFIRRTSIDELPQLVNVLRGELSLVGPRPHAVNAHTENRLWDEVVEGYFARHKVKPGVTGWAQINGWRGEVDTPEKIHRRVEFDLEYIERWSVLFDLYILMMTPFCLVNNENAY
jgi:Undecaprenyl-phosphate glucose phosphotransferase